MPNFFIGYDPDTYYLLPSLIIKIGRDRANHKPAAIMLSIVWLCFEAGMEVDIYTQP